MRCNGIAKDGPVGKEVVVNSSSANQLAAPARKYRSPLHALVWSFRKSRDNWKCKYLEVKAELKRARRRLDRVARTSHSSPAASSAATAKAAPLVASASPAPQADPATPVTTTPPATSSSPLASLLAFLQPELADLQQQLDHNKQQLERNREQLKHSQEQNRLLAELAQRLDVLVSTTLPLHPADSPASKPTPPPADTGPVLPPANTSQAPPEPKKGAHCHGRN